jgi:methionyl-tRNA formyltransferase
MGNKVVLLTTDSESGRITARYLAARFKDFAVLIEEPESRAVFLRRRLKRLGVATVAGQVAFTIFQRIQQKWSRRRIDDIVAQFAGESAGPEGLPVHRVKSVNTPECVGILKRLEPGVVLVMGTRIIAPEVMHEVAVPFINYHAGVTPKYRGVHGGYWALASSDQENFGATVHLVDEGIDSGGVLYQARARPAAGDNFSTYPYRQLAIGLPILAQAANDALAGHLAPRTIGLPSQLWSHPTLWGYLVNALRRGIW